MRNLPGLLAVSAAIGMGPLHYEGPVHHYEGAVSPSAAPGVVHGGAYAGPIGTEYPFVGSFGNQLYPYDAQEPWLHGYFQEIPAYGGYVAFRPYNYKHVFAQSQAAGGWGMPPTGPYSQQFWHRYHDQAVMKHAY